jgi:dephospho-CoA kinase
VKLVGLAGGIGTGKSTVGGRLAARGAHVIDVDQISRDVQRPGQPVFDEIVARWGEDVLAADGSLDRAALGRIVFADRTELGILTAMTADAIASEIVRRAEGHVGTDDYVVVEAAMMPGGENRLYGLEGLIVVDAPAEVAVARLVAGRGMTEEDARARVGAQAPREQRLADADHVVDNSGDLAALDGEIERAWAWIATTPDATPRLTPTRRHGPAAR